MSIERESLRRREVAAAAREHAVGLREQSAGSQETQRATAEVSETAANSRERALAAREEAAGLREDVLRDREDEARVGREVAQLNTRLRAANEQLIVASVKAQGAEEDAARENRLKDDFLSVASHELRNPINALQLQLVGLLRAAQSKGDSLDCGWVCDRLGQATDDVRRLARLVDRLLDVSRVAAGRLDLDLEDLDFGGVVMAVVERFREELGDRRVILQVSPAVGRWDQLRLEQVVTNLLSNAIKYGKGKPIEISLHIADDEACLSVLDHGIGIDEEGQQRLFQRFARATPKLNYGGLGLGLWITKQIVDAMGGHITVDSRPGQGSTFWVRLPCRRFVGKHATTQSVIT